MVNCSSVESVKEKFLSEIIPTGREISESLPPLKESQSKEEAHCSICNDIIGLYGAFNIDGKNYCSDCYESEKIGIIEEFKALKKDLEKEKAYSQSLKGNIEKILKEKKEIAEELKKLKKSFRKIRKISEALSLEVEE